MSEERIELRLREVNQLFNTMDPSPFPEKDLDSDAEEFIVSWARELPRKAKLMLLVHLSNPPPDRDPATMIEVAVRAFFTHRKELCGMHLRQMIARGRLSLIIGMAFLALCLFIADRTEHLGLGEMPLATIIRESVIIGGWVAMWRPMEIFLYSWWPILRERRIYDRLSRMPVRIACSKAESSQL